MVHCVYKTDSPRIVMLGLRRPSSLNRDSLETLASGSLGLGSHG